MTRTRRPRPIAALLAMAIALAGSVSCRPDPGVRRPDPPDPAAWFSTERCRAVLAAAASHPGRYAANSPFRSPASCAGRAADSDVWADRLFAVGGAPDPDPALRGRFSTHFTDWSVPRYDLAAPDDGSAVTTVRVFSTHSTSNLPNGTRIPYSNAFRPSGAVVNGVFRGDSDRVMVIHDSRTGQEWRMWSYPVGGRSTMPTDPGCSMRPDGSLTGFVAGLDLCVGAIYYARDANGTEPGPESTGVSDSTLVAIGEVFPLAGLVTAEEVLRGPVNHPLMLMTYATMFGAPACGPDIDVLGGTCGYHLFPASRVENVAGPLATCPVPLDNEVATRRTTLPQGMYFALNVSDDEIEWWLNDRGFGEPLRTTMGRLARALRDWGFFVAATGCAGSGFSMEGATTTAARARWNEAGIDPWAGSSLHLFDGLVAAPANLVRLAPPARP